MNRKHKEIVVFACRWLPTPNCTCAHVVLNGLAYSCAILLRSYSAYSNGQQYNWTKAIENKFCPSYFHTVWSIILLNILRVTHNTKKKDNCYLLRTTHGWRTCSFSWWRNRKVSLCQIIIINKNICWRDSLRTWLNRQPPIFHRCWSNRAAWRRHVNQLLYNMRIIILSCWV